MIRLADFRLDPESRVFTHPEDGGLAYSDGDESEAYLREVLASCGDRSSSSQELKARIKDWPSSYHLSPVRANLFRACEWLTPDLKVLELGAGCGGLTRYLGERCRVVTAVEGGLPRARIARQRCADLPGVAIYAGNIFRMDFEPRYDVVTLIGVLEYAPRFCPGEITDPAAACRELLRVAGRALKPEGTLVLAIENQLGLKYWAGCREDHTGLAKDGLYGYPGDPQQRKVVTFSRLELERLLRDSGFGWSEFYSCFPDYKLANTIIRQTGHDPAALFLANWVTIPFPDRVGEREYFLHEGLTARTLAHAGLFHELANSFLVLARKPEARPLTTAWIAKRFSADRKPEHATETTFTYGSEPVVVKRPLFPTGSAGVSERWAPGDLLLFDFYRAIFHASDPRGRLAGLLAAYHERILDLFGSGQRDADGYPLVTGAVIDFMPWNIIVHEGQWTFIDQEWRADEPTAVDFVLYRALRYFFGGQRPYLVRQGVEKQDLTALMIGMIGGLYPKYGMERHRRNQEREEAFQVSVNGTAFDLEFSSIEEAEGLDLAGREILRKKEQQRRESEARAAQVRVQLDSMTRALGEKEETLTAILHSRGWRTILKFRRLRHWLLPLGSKRERMARWTWRSLQHIWKGRETDHADQA